MLQSCFKKIKLHKTTFFYFIKLLIKLRSFNETFLSAEQKQRQNLILHSDQGWHFTNWQYRKLLVDNNIIQSISARGSSVDNIPIESFFSILKSECIYLIDNLYKRDIETVVNNFINYYNNERLQEKIKELTPIQFRELTLSASF